MQLIIAGGGGPEESKEADKFFLDLIDKEKPMLYIPIAMPREVHPPKECEEFLNSIFNPLGFNNIEMWLEEDLRNASEEDLQKFGSVYIGGGNTFYLMKELRESGFLGKLESLAKNNIPIYGGSAGGVILGKTIAPALPYDPNEVNLKDFSALNLVKNYDFWFHYTPEMDEEIKNTIQEHNLEKVVAIPETAALYATNEEIKPIGDKCYLFENGEKTEFI